MIYQQGETDTAALGAQRGRDYRAIAATIVLSAVYATLRYNVFKGVPWTDWPDYVGNKILALSSLLLIALAVLRLASRPARPIRRLMAIGSAFALTHTLVSLGLFRPAYFDKFFAGAKLSLAGGASLTIAATAMALLNWGRGRKGSSTPASSAVPLAIITFLSALHAALPSASTWLEPATWPGRMPPITLMSFVVGSVSLAFAFRTWRGRAPSVR